MDKQQRHKALETLCSEYNWLFSPKADISNVSILAEFEFHTGEKRKVEKVENLIIAGDVKIFDVYWKTEFDPLDAVAMVGHKDNFAKTVKYQTMFTFELNYKLPTFYVYPQRSVNLIEQWISKTFRQPNFPEYPEFEKRFSVRSNDKNFLNYFDEKLMEVYQTSEDFWTFGKDNFLFIYQPNILVEANKIFDWTDTLQKISKAFKTK